MCDCLNILATFFARQHSQRVTRSTSPSWKDFQPVPLQSEQMDLSSAGGSTKHNSAEEKSLTLFSSCAFASDEKGSDPLLPRVLFWGRRRAGSRRIDPHEIGRRRFHHRGAEPLLPVVDAASELALDVLHEL